MKFTKTKKIFVLLAVLAAMTCALAINALAANEYLTALTVYENGSASAAKSVTLGSEMTVNVSAGCNYVTATATCPEGYKAVRQNGPEFNDLAGEQLRVNRVYDICVINEAKEIVATYKLTANQIDTTLKDIKLSYTDANGKVVEEKPTKGSGNKYNINLDGKVKTVTLTVTPNSSDAEYQYGNDIAANGTIELDGKGAEVDFFIKHTESGEYTKYTLNITQNVLNNNTNLKTLVSSKGSFDKSFSASTTTYRVTVPYGTSSTTLRATAAEANAKVVINQTSGNNLAAAAFANASNTADLDTGSLSRGKTVTYYAHVLSSDGTAQKVYTVNVYRSNSSASDNADLKSLTVKYGSKSCSLMPAFDVDTKTYYVNVPRSENEIRITATPKDSNADVTIDGRAANSSNYRDVSLDDGDNTIKIVVTSESGEKETYTLYAYLADTKGTNCDAKDIEVRTGTKSSLSSSDKAKLNKTFSSSTTKYDVDTASSDKYFSVCWDRDDKNSTAYLIYDDKATDLSNGSFSSSFKIGSDSYFTVRVFSPDGSESQDYKFYLNGKGDSDDSYLSDLTVRANGTKVSLSPSFTKKTFNYIANVGTSATYVTITPSASDSGSTIWVNGSKVKSGNASSSISITSNSTRIPVKVESEDGNTTTYYVTVSKTGNVNNNNNQNGNQNINNSGKKMTMVMRINSTAYLLNNTNKKLLAPPYMDTKNNRTLVPIRAIAESMGATVGYDNVKKLVTVKLDDKNLSLTLGKEIVVGNINYGAPGLKNGTTFVPVRYISEQLGGKVLWDNKNKIVTVTR